MRAIKYLSFCFMFALLGTFSPLVFAEYTLNMTRGVTPVSHAIYDLHMLVFWICVVIGIVVFGIMIYALIAHRKSRGVKPAQFHEHTTVEVIWAIIPFIILIGMAIPATKVLIQMNDNSDSDINVKITGYQWKWHYDYIDDNVSYFSNLATTPAQIKNQAPKGEHYLLEVDRPLVIPVNKKIRFFITSNDVIHSWWVPSFGVKRDAVPGFIHEAWTKVEKPGIYRGQCAELCGVNHGFMPIVVDVKTQEGYDAWITKQKAAKASLSAAPVKTWTKEELMKKGEQDYLTYCSACHQPNGEGLPPTFPALKGGPIVVGPVAKHIDTVLNGVKGTAMQAFGNQLSETEIAAIITYERNAWGNPGGVVQPADIIAAKGGKPVTDTAQSQTGSSDDGSATSAEMQALAQSNPEAPSVTPLDTYKNYDEKELMKMGEEVYLRVCAVCHKPDGSGMPPTFPALVGSKIVEGPVSEHIGRVLNGVKGTAMQAFGSQLTTVELASVITYERNAWSNKQTAELVQPSDIEKHQTKLANKGE